MHKKVLKKSPLRRENFKAYCNIKLPPNPVVTRWRSWLTTGFYYLDNFEKISALIEQLGEDKKKKAIKDTKVLIGKNNLKDQLLSLNSFRRLPEIIKTIEKRSLTIDQQLNLIDEVKDFLPDFCIEKLNE